MTLEQALQKEIEDSQRWLNLEKDESIYRDFAKRIELISAAYSVKQPPISFNFFIINYIDGDRNGQRPFKG